MNGGCDDNFVGELKLYKPIYNIITSILEHTGASIIEFINAPVEILALLADMVWQMFDHMDSVCAYLESFVQLAKVEATYENSRWLMREIACRPSEPKRGNGCDGIDNNCDDDHLIDECAEDTVPPEIDLSSVYELCGERKVFQSVDEATACVNSYVKASDDCQQIKPLDVAATLSDATCVADIIVTASELECDLNTTESLTLNVDNTPPEVRCFIDNQNITNAGAGSYENIEFDYSIIDNCDSDVDVTVDVYSNELSDNIHQMAFISREAESIVVESAACGQDE